ncbi:hypothetical protein [Empedobacter brevis]|uniref:hypothetical protein n=1 Tax=Empedobacter brevis TaxID=247 RepID=UPI0028AE1C91|nr:hypothetical protein [Empedobacter brevis]
MSETTDKIVDKIVGDATSRLKIPIVSTYLCILIINNWDILYFIIFSKIDATIKILYVKTHYDFWDYLLRVGGSLIYAIFILVVFTFIDYYLVKWLKNVSIKKKGLQQQIIDHSTLEDLKKVIESLKNENKKLNKNIENFKKEKVDFEEEIIELNSKYSNTYEYVRFGQFIQEINKLPDNNINSKFYYLDRLLKYFNKSEIDSLINVDSMFEEISNSLTDKNIYFDIIIALQEKGYLYIHEDIKKNKLVRTIQLNDVDIDYLFLYLNIK